MKKNKYIAIINLLSLVFAITAILGTFRALSGTNIKTTKTALLNPQHAPLVNHISLHFEKPTQKLELIKNSSGYIGIYNDIQFPVNTTKVSEFLRLSSATIEAEIISNEIEDHVTFGVLDNSSVQKVVSFIGGDDSSRNIYSQIYFGETDFTGTRRYVRSAKSSTILAIQDNFYSFLTPAPSAWVDSKIIPHILRENFSEENIASVSFTDGTIKKTIASGDSSFESSVKTIFSLQSANVVNIKELSELHAQYELAITSFAGKIITVPIYSMGDSYIFAPNNASLFYGLDISEYTFSTLRNLFTD